MICKLIGKGAASATDDNDVKINRCNVRKYVVTIEPGDETKSCSTPSTNQYKHLIYSMCHATFDMWRVIITNAHFWVYTWKQNVFRTFKKLYIFGSQFLSNIQTGYHPYEPYIHLLWPLPKIISIFRWKQPPLDISMTCQLHCLLKGLNF